MRNTREVSEFITDYLQKTAEGEMDRKTCEALSNGVGKLVNLHKSQLEYNKFQAEHSDDGKVIEFYDYKDSKND